MKWIFFCLLAASGANAAELAGAYDLGPRAAAMLLQKNIDETGAEIGILTFCKRQTFLEKRGCTGLSLPIRCSISKTQWVCEEGGTYPFRGEITQTGPDRIHYRFKSSFNEGELDGIRFPIQVD